MSRKDPINSQTATQTIGPSVVWGPRPPRKSNPLKPRLRLLYHPDLSRIGAVSDPGALSMLGDWLVVGRKRPLFVSPNAEGVDRPLENPSVSRKQLQIRWVAHVGMFEIEPIPGSKRAIGLIMPGSDSMERITSCISAPPGACVAIENRALLGLEAASEHTSEEDRMGFIGECEGMWRIRKDILSLAAFHKPALIIGPTGAGKELIAQALHNHGPRADGPFLTVNSAALPEHLVESLLFGHKKGAFTGAAEQQTGVFRAADGGTLFLDEIGELPMSIQPKLLRALQDGHVVAVGQHQGVKVDVRLIAATNRVLEDEVAAGRMRADLYHRIAGHILHVPALNDRRFDIPALFVHFLKRLCDKDHVALDWLWTASWKGEIPMAFFVALIQADWKGNVRELENVVERAARLSLRDGHFTSPELPGRPEQPRHRGPEPSSRHPISQAPVNPKLVGASRMLDLAHKTVAKLLDEATLDRVWKRAADEGWDDAAFADHLQARTVESLNEALAACDFKQTPTAKALGVAPTTLFKLMERFGLPRPADLALEDIQRALQQTQGDVGAAARSLRVSAQGLRSRMKNLGLKRSG